MHFSALVYVSNILQYPNSNIASTSLLTRNNNGVYGVGIRVYHDALLHLVYNLLTCFYLSLTQTFVNFFCFSHDINQVISSSHGNLGFVIASILLEDCSTSSQSNKNQLHHILCSQFSAKQKNIVGCLFACLSFFKTTKEGKWQFSLPSFRYEKLKSSIHFY